MTVQPRYAFTFSALVIAMCITGPATAQFGGVTTLDPTLPPDGVYVTPFDVFATYGGGPLTVVLSDIQLQPFQDLPPNNACFPVCNEQHDFDTDLSGLVSINGGPNQPIHMDGRSLTVAYGKGPGDTTGSWPVEVLSMNLIGGPIMMRESPTLPSIGITSITDVGGGMYHIDSFFDVFTELSLDGGQTWMPSNGPTHIALVPEPAAIALVALAMLSIAGIRCR